MMDILNNKNFLMIFRLCVACMCGIAIGFERKNRAKEAGLRTHCIVACSAALMMLISKYGFFDIIENTEWGNIDVRLDPSRMAQGIVTGVGFLGAGIIYIQRSTIKGLTTAAGLWATSGIGMAIGSGMYVIGLAATVIILMIQIILHTSSRFMASHKLRVVKIKDVMETGFQDRATELLNDIGVSVNEVSIKKNSEKIFDYLLYCDMSNDVKEEDIILLFDYQCSVEIT